MENMLCLRNVTSRTVEEKKPWELEIEVPCNTKQEFTRWISDANTNYCIYSGFEGTDPTQRVSSQNKARSMYALVVDYDATLDDEEFKQFMKVMLEECPYPCTYVSRSFRKGVHAVWEFESSVLLHGTKPTKKLIDRLKGELKLDKLCRGLDAPALKDITKYYSLGTDWKKVSKDPIPLSWLYYLQYETSAADDFVDFGLEIPLDAVKAEVDRKFPGLWEGPFVEGARGRYFWANTPGINPSAAVVRPTGMQCFSGLQPFYSWAEVLGNTFVSQYETGRIGRCIKNYWYDGKGYFIEDEYGDYIIAGKDEAFLDLQARHNITNQRGRRENLSEAQRALFQIHTSKRVEAPVPFCFVKDRIVKHEGRTYFNTSRVQPIEPSEKEGEWGEHFPAIAEWLETMFGEEQLKWELAWLSYAYQGALKGQPRKGHAHFLVGPPNCGKTLYNTQILGNLFGGHMKCSEYLIGRTEFNDHLFETGFWTVDDEAGSGGEAHVQFSSRVKEFVANDSFVVNAKFKKSGRVFWRGRLSITLNNDPVSMRMIPDLDMSTRDKLMIFSCNTFDKFTKDFRDRVVAELPHFAAWLDDYKIPEEISDVRFGVKAFICETVNSTSQADSRYSHIQEILDIFKDRQLDEGDEWQGTCSELLQVMSKLSGCDVLLRDVNTRKLGWGMRHLASKGCTWLKRTDTKGSCQWKITKEKV
jgi:hypothetical protein